MKRLLCLIWICLSLAACSAEKTAQSKTIHIASMGSAEMFMGGDAFLNGINLAVKEANEEYGPQGYTIEHTWANMKRWIANNVNSFEILNEAIEEYIYNIIPTFSTFTC